jgi:hypothetical protein
LAGDSTMTIDLAIWGGGTSHKKKESANIGLAIQRNTIVFPRGLTRAP